MNISIEDIKWQRNRTDDDSVNPQIIMTQGNNLISITSNISGGMLTSVLMITHLRSAHVGPYWVKVADDAQLIMSAVAFLRIGPSGMTLLCIYMCTMHGCILVGV